MIVRNTLSSPQKSFNLTDEFFKAKEMMKLHTKGAAKWGMSPSSRDAKPRLNPEYATNRLRSVGWAQFLSV